MPIDALVRAIAATAGPPTPADAFLPRLSPAQWQRLGQAMARRELAPGEPLLHQGAREEAAHLLEAGELQVFVTGGPPGSHRIAVLRPGAVVGEPALFGPALRMAHVEALTPCAVWTLEAATLERLAAEQPLLALELLRAAGAVMAARMRANLERGIPVS